MTGMLISLRIMSSEPFSTWTSPSAPLLASRTSVISRPAWRSARSTIFRITAESSTIRTFSFFTFVLLKWFFRSFLCRSPYLPSFLNFAIRKNGLDKSLDFHRIFIQLERKSRQVEGGCGRVFLLQ